MSFGNCSQLTFLSLESVLGFCHRIAKGGDCKVEFIQLCVGFILCAKFACNSAFRNPVFG